MEENTAMSFVAISGISFPSRSRKYLMGLVRQIVERHNSKFVVVAGGMIAGRELEKELKHKIRTREIELKKEKLKKSEKGDKKIVDKVAERLALTENFINEKVAALNDFLPKLNGVNYHIVIAESILDRPIGTTILEGLAKLRGGADGDIRLYTDPEAKMAVQVSGFGELRVLVPRKTPWFYENITGLTQRLVNSFMSKTFSPKPRLILVGGTGTGSLLPRYGPGVSVVSIPTLNKIEEQLSTENMVGCVVINIAKHDDDFRIVPKFYDFRTAVFNEKAMSLPGNLSKPHQRVIDVLKPGSASLGTIEFQLNQDAKHPWKPERVKQCIDELIKRKILVYAKKSNCYSIANSLVDKTMISLEEFEKDKTTLSTVDMSCCHSGSLKGMYYTLLREVPRLGFDADANIDNGDLTQGISHNYEYNGELLPVMNGAEKHELLAALLKTRHIMDIFQARWDVLKREKLTTLEIIDRCLILYAYKYGNHDEHRFSSSKHGRPLTLFDEKLRSRLLSEVVSFLEKHKHNDVTNKQIEDVVNRKIMRIGESRVTTVKGFMIGVKHPYQSRTASKGMRIKQTADFYLRSLTNWPELNKSNISNVKVANFHEAATIFVGVCGRTICGVMTGAQVYDTLFESNQNKVVDYGIAKTIVDLNKQGQVLSASVEYTTYIAPEDYKILFSDNLTLEDVSDLCLRLSRMFNMNWR